MTKKPESDLTMSIRSREAMQWRKAARLIATTMAGGAYDVETLLAAPDSYWHVVSTAAKINAPSEETIALVRETLQLARDRMPVRRST